jgi:hypothetical protein
MFCHAIVVAQRNVLVNCDGVLRVILLVDNGWVLWECRRSRVGGASTSRVS